MSPSASGEDATPTFGDLVWGHPVILAWLSHGELRASEAFGQYQELAIGDRLVLLPFCTDRPQRFFNRAARLAARSTLENLALCGVPVDVNEGAASALAFLWRLNAQRIEADETYIEAADPLREHRLRDEVLPLYSQLAENVYDGLLALLVSIELRRISSTSAVGPQLRNRWEQATASRLSNAIPASITGVYNPRVRNAIVHGGVRITRREVTFQDRTGSAVVLTVAEAAALAANLLDVCNAISAAVLECVVTKTVVLTGAMAEWERTARALATTRTLRLLPTSCFFSEPTPGLKQVEVHGTHTHWRVEEALTEIGRAFVAARTAFPDADSFFLSFSDARGGRCFFSLKREQVPTEDESLATSGTLSASMGKSGLAWMEQESLLRQFAGRLPLLKTIVPWFDIVDIPMTGGIDYCLRSLADNSVGRKLRFDAHVISRPTTSDLDDDCLPKSTYLRRIFGETAFRAALRLKGSRPMGANRLRLPRSGTIEVYCEDRRRLANSGLPANRLFRFQLALGRGHGIALAGGSMHRIGSFSVCINDNARRVLNGIKDGTVVNFEEL